MSGLSCVPDEAHLVHSTSLSPSTHLWSDKKKIVNYKQRALSSIDIPMPLTNSYILHPLHMCARTEPAGTDLGAVCVEHDGQT